MSSSLHRRAQFRSVSGAACRLSSRRISYTESRKRAPSPPCLAACGGYTRGGLRGGYGEAGARAGARAGAGGWCCGLWLSLWLVLGLELRRRRDAARHCARLVSHGLQRRGDASARELHGRVAHEPHVMRRHLAHREGRLRARCGRRALPGRRQRERRGVLRSAGLPKKAGPFFRGQGGFLLGGLGVRLSAGRGAIGRVRTDADSLTGENFVSSFSLATPPPWLAPSSRPSGETPTTSVATESMLEERRSHTGGGGGGLVPSRATLAAGGAAPSPLP